MGPFRTCDWEPSPWMSSSLHNAQHAQDKVLLADSPEPTLKHSLFHLCVCVCVCVFLQDAISVLARGFPLRDGVCPHQHLPACQNPPAAKQRSVSSRGSRQDGHMKVAPRETKHKPPLFQNKIMEERKKIAENVSVCVCVSVHSGGSPTSWLSAPFGSCHTLSISHRAP